jgi:large subunit ribosomal protein L19
MSISLPIEVTPNPNIPALTAGDTVKVRVKVAEAEKERTQSFQGVVIRVRHGADGGSFTVRRVAYGVGVERTFLINSPLIDKVELVRHGKVRRARLYYLRGLSAKAARIKEKRARQEETRQEPEETRQEPEETRQEQG